MKKFWKREKTKEEIFKDMQADEKITLLKTINKNREEGKAESENLIPLRELNYHASIEAEQERAKTEKANRRTWYEKLAAILSPIIVVLTSFWTAHHDMKGDNVNRTDGGRRINTLLNSIAAKFIDIKNYFRK